MSTRTPGWRPDPYGRAGERFWDGDQFTAKIRTGDEESVDSLGATATIPFTNPTGIKPKRAQPNGFAEPGLWSRLKNSMARLFRR